MKYQRQTRGRSERAIPQSGVFLLSMPGDRSRYESMVTYTPERLTSIMSAANSGDIEQLAICAREIMERNWDVIGAMEQRADAISGVKWDIVPGGAEEIDKAAAKAFAAELAECGELNGYDTFYDLIRNLTDAVIAPFAAAEIIWTPGGGLGGFKTVDAWHFSLRESFVPRLICDEFPNGMELPPDKFVVHRFKKKQDPARSGLIRTLAWLHVFQNFPIKDLFSFVERYGMPFVLAKVDRQTWEEELVKLHQMVRQFGPSGGGVVTNSTDISLLQAANSEGNVYFRLLDYTREAIYRTLVGQLASSSDGQGLSGGGAQSAVRQDILEADARALESTIRAQIAAPWTRYNFGAAAVPKIHFQTEPPEDTAAFATTVATLYNAGLEADPAEVGEKVGLKLTRREMPVMGMDGFGQFGQGGQTPTSTEDADAAHNLNLKQKYDAMGVAIRAGLLTATPEIEAQTRTELGLPAMTPEVQKAWEATGGIRQPITLKTAESAAVEDALNIEDEDTDKIEQDVKALSAEKRQERGEALVAALQWGLIHQTRGTNALLSATLDIPVDAIVLKSKPVREKASGLSDALEEMFGPFADAADRIIETLDDETLTEEERKKRLREIELKTGSGSGMEKLMVKDMEKQYALGKDRG